MLNHHISLLPGSSYRSLEVGLVVAGGSGGTSQTGRDTKPKPG